MAEDFLMADRFGSSRAKLDRARKHADDLGSEISGYWSAQPCQLEPAPDDSAEVSRFRVTQLSPLPDSISIVAGDAAHNIRSALDHFAWAAVAPPARTTRTAFPIRSAASPGSPEAWRSQVERQLSGASRELISIVASMEPWPGGQDEFLWAAHELDRVDKHRLLLSTAVTLARIHLHGDSYELATAKRFSGWDPSGPLPVEPVEWTPVEENTVLTVPLTGPDLGGTETTLQFNVVFGEPELLRTTAATQALKTLADSAEKTIQRMSSLA